MNELLAKIQALEATIKGMAEMYNENFLRIDRLRMEREVSTGELWLRVKALEDYQQAQEDSAKRSAEIHKAIRSYMIKTRA